MDKARWKLEDINDSYGYLSWGDGYLSVNDAGHLVVDPERDGRGCDLYQLTQTLVQRGIEAPILVRFNGIIRDRIKCIYAAFESAIEEFHYKSRYQLVFPIKVNQQKHVVDVIRQAGRSKALGLEVGSKPEMLAILSIHDTEGALLLCNGYKDAEYIELALLASKLGRRPLVIIEQLSEIKLVLEVATRLGIEPELGFRMKPSSRGSGRWESSGGEQAKFGLSGWEIVQAIEILKTAGKLECVKLLHYHIGSQVTSIMSVKRALREGGRMYTELAKMCPNMTYFDAGGGLGVDYTGSRSTDDSSMNYTVEEYARDVVSIVGEACDKAHIAHPTLVTESGRAIVAHHSVLITEVIDVVGGASSQMEIGAPPSNHEMIQEIAWTLENLSSENCQEILHDVLDIRDRIVQRFVQGNLSLPERGYAEQLLRKVLAQIKELSIGLEIPAEDLSALDELLLDTYFCNFSVFQSLPDSWAIQQLFPIMPIHRLDEPPTRHARLSDLSCDSDGKIHSFVWCQETPSYLPVHPINGGPYYLGIFLVGAYQEILGALHNLFGDTNAVHVDIDADGKWDITHLVEGNSMEEVLSYVQYHSEDLTERLRLSIEKSLKAGRISYQDAASLRRRFKAALESYTYLVV